jgi:peptidoglycan hydrolase-like protein with peptidoglycan-binding domain
VAFEDIDVGVRILAGLGAFALLMALMSDDAPDNDAWAEDGSAATRYDYDVDGPADGSAPALRRGAGGDGGLPGCDSTAPFAGAAGTITMPSDGPLPVLASAECRLDRGAGDADAVSGLQRALALCNGQPVGADGVYGPETRSAVEAVQADHGLVVDGTYGPDTGRAMSWSLTAADGCGPAPSP